MRDETVGPAPISATAPEPERPRAELCEQTPDEIGRLLEEFRPYLLAIALEELPGALGGKLGASDLVQDTITRGFEHLGAFQGSTREELAGWLRSILRNLLANVVKSYQTERRDISREQPGDSRVEQAGQKSPSTEALSREQWELLQNALSRLSEVNRQTILFRYRDDLTFAEIGGRIGKSEEAARKVWSRAVQQLQQELQQHDSQGP